MYFPQIENYERPAGSYNKDNFERKTNDYRKLERKFSGKHLGKFYWKGIHIKTECKEICLLQKIKQKKTKKNNDINQ